MTNKSFFTSLKFYISSIKSNLIFSFSFLKYEFIGYIVFTLSFLIVFGNTFSLFELYQIYFVVRVLIFLFHLLNPYSYGDDDEV